MYGFNDVQLFNVLVQRRLRVGWWAAGCWRNKSANLSTAPGDGDSADDPACGLCTRAAVEPPAPEWVTQAEEYVTKGVYCAGAPYNYSCAPTATAHRLGRPVGTCFSSTSPYVLFEYIMHRKGQGPIHAH